MIQGSGGHTQARGSIKVLASRPQARQTPAMAQAHPGIWLKPWSAATRLSVAVALGLAVELALRQFWSASLSAILAWDAAVVCFLGLTFRVIVDHSVDSIRRRAARLDTAAWVMMLLVVLAACISLFGLALAFHGADGALPNHPTLRLLLAGFTVLGSWSLIHTIFALHYAHLFYGKVEGGLIFPGGGDPDYWDFLYYSFVVGMTCQVSDVQVAAAPLRRLTLVHGALSFFFNTIILALAVSVGAGLL
jgi:uncharacterized membrane protein